MREVAHSDASLSHAVATGLGFWRAHIFDDAALQAAIFMPVQMFNFRFNPPHLRVPTLVVAGVVWISALSLLRPGRCSRTAAGAALPSTAPSSGA